jgi:hypothetical protein
MLNKLNKKNLKTVLLNNGSISFFRLNSFKRFQKFEIDFYNNNLFIFLKKINEK